MIIIDIFIIAILLVLFLLLLLGKTVDSSKLISLLTLQDGIHQELSNINVTLNILKKEAESNDHYLKKDESKVNKIDQQIIKKCSDNDDDKMILLHNREVSNMLNEDLLTHSIMLKSSSDDIQTFKTERNTLNTKM